MSANLFCTSPLVTVRWRGGHIHLAGAQVPVESDPIDADALTLLSDFATPHAAPTSPNPWFDKLVDWGVLVACQSPETPTESWWDPWDVGGREGRCHQILRQDLGHATSLRPDFGTDLSIHSKPLWCYPMLAWLAQVDWSEKRIFEYGSGASTLFWAQHSHQVTAVERDKEWADRLTQALPNHARVLLQDNLAYTEAIHQSGSPWDVIVIDGHFRFDCALEATKALASGGLIILDNAVWYPRTAAHLRSADLLQVDFSGFAPTKSYVQTTSVFFHSACRLNPASDRQPTAPIGGVETNSQWDWPDRFVQMQREHRDKENQQ